jgi:hypothetical protein
VRTAVHGAHEIGVAQGHRLVVVVARLEVEVDELHEVLRDDRFERGHRNACVEGADRFDPRSDFDA